MSYATFLDRVQEHTGLVGEDLEEAVRATVEVLGELVGAARREVVAEALPGPLGQAFRARSQAPCTDREAFVSRVAAAEQVPPSQAVEHATAVLEAVSAQLDDDVRAVLRAELPEDLRGWIELRREEAPEPSVHPPHAGRGRHLSDGRPGSTHPMSESAAPRAHSGSVVRSGDPHADTKLSEARGVTQERERETLAEGEPETRPISESGD